MTDAKPRASHHHGNLKEALIAYAMTAASSGTLEQLSLRKASRDLGVSPGAAYRHFADRDALMRCVAQHGFDALAAAFEAVLPYDSAARSDADAKARFLALAGAYVRFARENYGLWRLMFGPYGLAPRAGSARPSTYEWLAKSLSELADHGVIAASGPDAQFFAWSAIHGLSDLQASPAIAQSKERSPTDAQCRFILAALRQAA